MDRRSLPSLVVYALTHKYEGLQGPQFAGAHVALPRTHDSCSPDTLIAGLSIVLARAFCCLSVFVPG